MKKLFSIFLVVFIACATLQGCDRNNTNVAATKSNITEKMAYEGVNNYCHSEFDWSVAEDNSSIMYVSMGDETESEYEVIFRSYTGSFINFYVDKETGTTRMIEYVPDLDIENSLGTIEISDYLK